ncbi:MAG: prolipoprotein diacylglyceryl transferase [Lachnospiraceae bacterium]|jgi:phosphatidylglycerol:prolipoprotein diacylglycerol transferase|uniref:Prolipoprotein diacylglyceryl transferase n=1 Tax=Hominisplanchenecus murintestinalis TaxID=2941517 RepID=A0AC61R321_9FIRM|nr:prolipoprotein diacylglyceryl transferase [Hominisplanchenecus murintestinalis]MCI9515851.1 prolipoprotein diacylglyceryl transferase [Lachnospiraceae bacterium]RKJ97680.1 prolipoprotein diacylglyceryl transferase [Anaerotruncus sp. 1XD22-93]MCI9660204.1 prolipoprotein diacylglyceryl transferase [Lachnospiraceae bacterium]NBH97522.1 prolipoprotein diacylglyceryl transferase [Lachnospiraceae bacterium]NBI74534.1 prolipoprotein diacylglyceryl transferase [Lachnospiraceae bacterium]
MNKNINFPHLGIYLENVGKSISIFGFEIAFYGITIAAAMLAGLWIAMRTAKKTGQNPDLYFDMGMLAIFCALIGARAYYVVFAWENYKNNLLEIFNLRHGGLAIYGGVIGGAVAVYMFARMKKQKFLQLADTASVGLVLGQIIGRWGNFFNREAFGGYTDNLFAMQLPLDAVYSWDVTPEMMENLRTAGGVQYIQVHPTFLYESLWNLMVLVLLAVYTKRKKFDGEVFCLYLLGYGLGRAWIEGLRTDQLWIPGTEIPVSQVLAVVLVVVSAAIITVKRRKAKIVESTGDECEKN